MIRACLTSSSLAALLVAAPASAQTSPNLWNGVWRGAYNCGDGIIQMQLSIETDESGMASALFEFAAPDERGTATGPWVPLGSFTMSGQIGDDGSFSLRPGSWVKPAYRFDTVGLSGQMVHAGEVQASIVGASCSTLRLRR
jgi:hypothetical protein